MPKNAHQLHPCANCGAQFHKFPRNRQYCGVCQALRDLKYQRGKECSCGTCGKGFFPIRSSYKDCYECSDWRGGVSDKNPECAICGQRKRTAPGVEKTCLSCVQSSAEMQKRYYLTIQKITSARLLEVA